MKTIGRFPAGPLLALAGCLLIPLRSLPQDTGWAEGYSTNAEDQAKCRIQLNILYGAIQQYRQRHDGELPPKLSDLGRDLIADPTTYICPYVQNRGGLRNWKRKFRDWANDSQTSYSYEFSMTPLDLNHWRGSPRKTWRQFKEAQMAEVGPVVPIVRCLDHRPCLNLGMDGRIYESGTYWERNFSKDDHLLTVANVFKVKSKLPLSERDFLARDPAAGTRLLDLTRSYNGVLTNDWQGFPGNHLGDLPPGIHKFDGVRFDIRGVIQLRGSELPADFPVQVSGIAVHQKCSRIHFLHATSFEYKADTVQATYRMHYSNGTVQQFPAVYGQHFSDWWRHRNDPAVPDKATVAWTGENEASKAFERVTALYHATWENPSPDTEITSITFDAGNKQFHAGPFVVAITLE